MAAFGTGNLICIHADFLSISMNSFSNPAWVPKATGGLTSNDKLYFIKKEVVCQSIKNIIN
jgi:hypothetical protein